MSARLVHVALGAATREIRRDVKRGATWADAHVIGHPRKGHATVRVDSSTGFDELSHPERGDSQLPATTIFVRVA
jgi:hypothetical protein